MVMRLLLAHEIPLFSLGLQSFLSRQDAYRVIGSATQLEDLLKLAREQRPDVALLSADLPTANPLALTTQLRALGIAILVFASETNTPEQELFQFMMHGACAYVPSFISPEVLLDQLERIHRGEYLISGDVAQLLEDRHKQHAARQKSWLLALSKQQTEEGKIHILDEVSRSRPEQHPVLNARECAVLEQVARGLTNEEVAQSLKLSPNTIKNIIHALFRKLGVSDRTGAVVEGLRRHLITAHEPAAPPRSSRRVRGERRPDCVLIPA